MIRCPSKAAAAWRASVQTPERTLVIDGKPRLRRWHRLLQRLELVAHRRISRPSRRADRIGIPAVREPRPVADHRVREVLLGGSAYGHRDRGLGDVEDVLEFRRVICPRWEAHGWEVEHRYRRVVELVLVRRHELR